MTTRTKITARIKGLEKEKRDLGNSLMEITLKAERSDEDNTTAKTAQERIIAIHGEIDELEAVLETMPEDVTLTEIKPEDRECQRVMAAAQAGAIQAVAEMDHDRRSDHNNGPLAELQQEYGLSANYIPVDVMFAAGLTPAPTNIGVNQAPVQGPIFRSGDAAWMGVQTPVVESGDQVYPVITTRPTVGGPHTDGTDIADTQLTVSTELLSPSRIGASIRHLNTQALRMPQMEPAFRNILNGALREAFDTAVVKELLTVTQIDKTSNIVNYSRSLQQLIYDFVDGRYATSPADIGVMVGPQTYNALSTFYRANGSETSALDRIGQLSAGIRATANLSALTGSNKNQEALVRVGSGRRNAVCPVWRGVEITTDRITGATKGEVEVIATMYYAVSVSDANGFKRVDNKILA